MKYSCMQDETSGRKVWRREVWKWGITMEVFDLDGRSARCDQSVLGWDGGAAGDPCTPPTRRPGSSMPMT